jgi:murein DD-endopeptidase MepM/ murein hydrolase activator NlpD
MSKAFRLISFFLIIGLIATPLPSSAQGSGPIYIVQPGDTLSAIARRLGVSQESLIQVNNISDPSRLFPGDSLLIPGFPGIEGELTLRLLDLGETVESISRFYGIDPLDLARLNRMVQLDTAYVGQSIIVPVQEGGDSEANWNISRITRTGETRLELAAQAGLSPWEASMPSQNLPQYWILPGTMSHESGEPRTENFPSILPEFRISPLPLVQGKTAILEAWVQDGYGLTGSLGDRALTFFPHENGTTLSLQGIHALQEPGLLDLRLMLIAEDSGEEVYGFSQRVLVNEGDYGFQILNGVPPETVDPAYTQPEEDLIRELLAPKTAEKLWDGAFDFPSRYYTEEFISVFGTRRNYNNGALLYYHTGLDFYGQNVPIYAPADGIVVFADSLTVRGNATYIDHGWGVYSGYLHQSEIYVEVGDRVSRGQVIGQVGATGRATGPHLHWEIWVGGVPVEPLDWVKAVIP